jgi:enoyl-CoA hydratase
MRYDFVAAQRSRRVLSVSHMALQNIVLERAEDGVVTLTMNRPAKLNALNADTIADLDSAFREVETDPSVRGLIITGAGEKAFVAGADINELAASEPVRAVDLALRGQRLFRRLELMGKPSVAAINGFALGGGLELAMACTVRIASQNARMGQPEVKLGIIAGYGGTQRLPALVGRGRALELLLTGEMIDATEAHRIGLVNHVVPQVDIMPFARGLLGRMLANAPIALGLTMQAVDVGLNSGLEEGLRFEATAFGVAASTEDKREGTQAFLEKRAAAFKGK